MKRFLSVPVIVDDKIEAVVGVANKELDYDEKDVNQVTLLMDGLWKVVERHVNNKEFVAFKEKAEKSKRLKPLSLTNLSHAVRTPMNGILGFVEMLRKSNISAKEKEEYLEIIEKSGNKMLDTINDLVDISRIESNQLKIDYSIVNLNEQIDSLVKNFEPVAASKGIQFLHKKAFGNEDAFIETNKEKLNIILSNLIENAVNYTKEGTVEFGYNVNGANLQFFVKDTGIGIERNRHKAVFDRFVQSETSLSKPYEETGLGLSVAKAYVELLGGKIWVESEKGKGSEFIFEIPFKKDDKKTEPVSKEPKKPATTSKDKVLQRLTVLVAEDDEVGRIYLKQMLDGKCKKMFYAKNGKEAVDIYRKNPEIDLILMDIKMPVMDGYSATIKIRSIDYNVKIVAQTAYALSGDREKAIAAGCDDYITKPLSKETLMSTIDKYFSAK